MTDDERAALVERLAAALWSRNYDGWPTWGSFRDDDAPGLRDSFRDDARAILAAIEPAIRADERARVVGEATTDEATRAALAIYWANPNWRTGTGDHQHYRILAMRSAIHAALGVENQKAPE